MWTTVIFALVIVEAGLSFGAYQWAYKGEFAPQRWHLSYPDCAGDRQSPIDLRNFTDFDKPKLTWTGYTDKPQSMTLRNTGRTLELSSTGVEPNISMASGKIFNLDHVQFHWGSRDSQGSEHKFEGMSYALEMQAVYLRVDKTDDTMADPELLITATLMQPKPRHGNAGMRNLVHHVPSVTKANTDTKVHPFPWADLLQPFDSDFVSYEGSMTNPPCTKATVIVSRKTRFMTDYLMDLLRQTLDERNQPISNNFRPLQKRAGRLIYLKRAK